MDIKNLQRDGGYIKNSLTEMEDGSIIFTKPAKILMPKKWAESDLVQIANPIVAVAVFAIIIDDKYGVSTVNSLLNTDPSTVTYDNVNGEEYIVFNYLPNDRFIINKSLVKRDILPYKLFTFLFDKGQIPWYLNYVDVSQIYDSCIEFADVKFNLPHSVFEMVACVIARNKGNKYTFYRHGDWEEKPTYIPLRSVQFAASNTTAKLIGAYWSDGLASALVYPSDRNELIEELLRS